jgi:hypothetical protein
MGPERNWGPKLSARKFPNNLVILQWGRTVSLRPCYLSKCCVSYFVGQSDRPNNGVFVFTCTLAFSRMRPFRALLDQNFYCLGILAPPFLRHTWYVITQQTEKFFYATVPNRQKIPFVQLSVFRQSWLT